MEKTTNTLACVVTKQLEFENKSKKEENPKKIECNAQQDEPNCVLQLVAIVYCSLHISETIGNSCFLQYIELKWSSFDGVPQPTKSESLV